MRTSLAFLFFASLLFTAACAKNDRSDGGADGSTLGFDCGPANALLDEWAQRHLGAPYDVAGRWAAGGTVRDDLLRAMLAEPYFAMAPPKGTGRDLFNPAWLAAPLARCRDATPQDVQATLAELSARASAEALIRHARGARHLLVCGGGAANDHLMSRLAVLLPGVAVQPTDAHGLPAMQVEAAAFAWLAKMHGDRRCASLPSVTGATGARILGALYPAGD